MPQRRILVIWFSSLAIDIVLRREPGLSGVPVAVVADEAGRQVVLGATRAAVAAGVAPGLGLTDARAVCPDLLTRAADPVRQGDVLAALRRWLGRISPWVGEEGTDTLRADLTGSAHLFGGEAALAETLSQDCAQLGFTVRLGIANTPGAAWAVARFDRAERRGLRTGDAIDQEARATRSRAAKRPDRRAALAPRAEHVAIVPPDGTRATLAPLPVAALRLAPDTVEHLARLGLRRVEDLAVLPRAALARRFGIAVVRRLDQAFGSEPEPISPSAQPLHFATRMNLPDPIGLEADLQAGIDRLLPPLCARLKEAGRGARHLRLTATRSDGTQTSLEIGLARPTHDAGRIRPILALKLPDIDAGFGIDRLRLHAFVTEPLTALQHSGHAEAAAAGRDRLAAGEDAALTGLWDRLGARLGTEALTRLHPADSHIPKQGATVMAALFSAPADRWPPRAQPRPLRLFVPERITPIAPGPPPKAFRWRRRDHRVAIGFGPERIAPEWWHDDPDWRSGARDYWRIETTEGTRLWLFEVRAPDRSGGWFVEGDFG
ncbi:MAG: DNA polymerase Y family protein [Pseudomonadota bacterium]